MGDPTYFHRDCNNSDGVQQDKEPPVGFETYFEFAFHSLKKDVAGFDTCTVNELGQVSLILQNEFSHIISYPM